MTEEERARAIFDWHAAQELRKRKEAKVSEEQAPYGNFGRTTMRQPEQKPQPQVIWVQVAGAQGCNEFVPAGVVPTEQPPMSRERFRQEAFLAAMQGLLASGPHDCKAPGIAHVARQYADALLAELERTRG